MSVRRERWAAGAILVLVAAACASESASGPARTDPTVPTAPPATTTTTVADPYAIPEVIDEAYVNRVLAGLDQALGDVLRLVIRSRSIPPEALDRLKAIYADQRFLQLRVNTLQADLAHNLEDQLPEPGNVRTTVSRLMSVDSSCIFASVHRDFSALTDSADPRLETQWISIVPSSASTHNPTRWAYIYEGFERGFVPPEDPCTR